MLPRCVQKTADLFRVDPASADTQEGFRNRICTIHQKKARSTILKYVGVYYVSIVTSKLISG